MNLLYNSDSQIQNEPVQGLSRFRCYNRQTTFDHLGELTGMPSDKDQRSILRIVPDTSQHLPGEILETPAGREQSDSVCPLCFGTGMEIVPGKGARRCSCRSQDRRTSLLTSARIPPRYEHCVLSNYQAESHEDSKWRAKQQA